MKENEECLLLKRIFGLSFKTETFMEAAITTCFGNSYAEDDKKDAEDLYICLLKFKDTKCPQACVH